MCKQVWSLKIYIFLLLWWSLKWQGIFTNSSTSSTPITTDHWTMIITKFSFSFFSPLSQFLPSNFLPILNPTNTIREHHKYLTILPWLLWSPHSLLHITFTQHQIHSWSHTYICIYIHIYISIVAKMTNPTFQTPQRGLNIPAKYS